MNTPIQKLEDLHPLRPIHLCGIGGSAMNGLAGLLAQRGFVVRGTDPSIDRETLNRLTAANVAVSTVQDGSTIDKKTQLVVTTAALQETHPELVTARAYGIPVIKYAAMLGVVMNSFVGIAVSGTHGKTSTSAMTVAALRGAGLNPGFVIGGYIEQFGAGAHGGETYLVAEACEYDRSFLNLHPKVAVITNIEADHLDMYAGIDEIVETFHQFTLNLTADGTLIYCAENEAATKLAEGFDGRKRSYGFKNGDCTSLNIENREGMFHFDVVMNDTIVAAIDLKLPGRHNILNALAAFCTGYELGIPAHALATGLSGFTGVRRRFEQIGIAGGVTIIDDYAHHPTEIRALLQGARERFKQARIVVAFQPHQISRTKYFFEEFASSFQLADHVLLPDIYIARDTEQPADINSKNLAARIRTFGTPADYTPSFEDTAVAAVSMLKKDDIFITVGAGNIYEVATRVVTLLS